MLAPGALYLAIFFLIPIGYMFYTSLQSGFIGDFHFNWHFANYSNALKQYGYIYVRSLTYAGIVTVLALILAYPVAYWIAFYGGRRKSVYLFLLLLPFFVSFIIRTVQWQFLLKDDGLILGPLKRIGLLPENYHVLGTSIAVIAGITYNFLPFTAPPYTWPRTAISGGRGRATCTQQVHDVPKIVWPLALPGVFAAFLLTFVPAVGDYVNASILGGPGNTMIGNVIQSTFLTNFDYPIAAAMSFILMAALLVGATIYARVLGTEDVTAGAASA